MKQEGCHRAIRLLPPTEQYHMLKCAWTARRNVTSHCRETAGSESHYSETGDWRACLSVDGLGARCVEISDARCRAAFHNEASSGLVSQFGGCRIAGKSHVSNTT